MIDWIALGTATLWVMGLAVTLAALSHAHWLAGQRRAFIPWFILGLAVALHRVKGCL